MGKFRKKRKPHFSYYKIQKVGVGAIEGCDKKFTIINSTYSCGPTHSFSLFKKRICSSPIKNCSLPTKLPKIPLRELTHAGVTPT